MPNGNPDIVKFSKDTQFGAGNDPSAAAKKSGESRRLANATRASARRIACGTVGTNPTIETLAKLFGATPKTLTGGQLAAIKMFSGASNPKMMALFIESSEGKLPNLNVNSTGNLADLIAGDFEKFNPED